MDAQKHKYHRWSLAATHVVPSYELHLGWWLLVPCRCPDTLGRVPDIEIVQKKDTHMRGPCDLCVSWLCSLCKLCVVGV
jgi:hypothetical protein